MKRSIWIILFTGLLVCAFSSAYAGAEQQKEFSGLVQEKCTKCHDAARAQKIHGNKKSAMAVVKEMQKKEGADISDEQALEIAGFLEAPYWQQPLLKSKCVKCHSLDVIDKMCGKDPSKPGIPIETIKLMQQKGADITDKQVGEIYEIFKRK